MKIQLIILSILFAIASSCGSPTDSGMTKKKTITSQVAQQSKTKTTNESSENNTTSEEEVIIPKEQLFKAKEIIESVTTKEKALIDGKLLFKKNCSICHGIKGNMKINGAKDLTKSKATLVKSVAQVYFGRKLMTPFKGKLTDTEIVVVSEYANSLRDQ